MGYSEFQWAEMPTQVAPGDRLDPRRDGLSRITVVDDNDEFVDLLRDMFSRQFDVSAVTPAESLNAIADTRPDLLIVDLHPRPTDGELTGWEIIALARSHRELRNVPIIVCTADMVALMNDGDRLGEYPDVHVVSKPFELQVIEGLVGRLLRSQVEAS